MEFTALPVLPVGPEPLALDVEVVPELLVPLVIPDLPDLMGQMVEMETMVVVVPLDKLELWAIKVKEVPM